MREMSGDTADLPVPRSAEPRPANRAPIFPDLHGACAVITGGSGGLGGAVAVALGRNGCSVALLDVTDRREAATPTLGALERFGVQSAYVAADVLDVGGLDDAFGAVERQFGPPRLLVNCAGLIIRKPALEITSSDWDAVMDVGLKGSFLASQAAAPRMRNAGGGAIVNLSSIFGIVGAPNRAPYAASKAGVISLTRVLAIEWHSFGIRVNAVAPAFVRTHMTEELLRTGLDVPNKSLIAPMVEPEDVASAVLFLLSDAASHMITGQVIAVDGGWTTW
jgi:NAD(P)-dependent dehydrogenase (short-subunit alcohol dehydrogenase family)